MYGNYTSYKACFFCVFVKTCEGYVLNFNMPGDLSCKMFSCTFAVQVVFYGYVGFCFAMIFLDLVAFFPLVFYTKCQFLPGDYFTGTCIC